MIKTPITGKGQKRKLAIFDMDQTLVDETLYRGVEEILEHLKKNNYRMAIASYNPYARWLCERYSITHYFDIICGYYDPKGKTTHIDEIKLYLKPKQYFSMMIKITLMKFKKRQKYIVF